MKQYRARFASESSRIRSVRRAFAFMTCRCLPFARRPPWNSAWLFLTASEKDALIRRGTLFFFVPSFGLHLFDMQSASACPRRMRPATVRYIGSGDSMGAKSEREAEDWAFAVRTLLSIGHILRFEPWSWRDAVTTEDPSWAGRQCLRTPRPSLLQLPASVNPW